MPKKVKEFILNVDGKCDFEYDDGSTLSINLDEVQVPATESSLSGVSYDGSNRCTGFTLNGVDYVITGWGSSEILVSGSDDSTRTISLDGSGRISGVI